MSSPRYDWWPYVKGMIRRYPDLCEEYADLHSQSITANYSGMPRGGGVGRIIESLAVRESRVLTALEWSMGSRCRKHWMGPT